MASKPAGARKKSNINPSSNKSSDELLTAASGASLLDSFRTKLFSDVHDDQLEGTRKLLQTLRGKYHGESKLKKCQFIA
jgi:hypothetical protein